MTTVSNVATSRRTPRSDAVSEIVVVGAGPAGLTAGWRAALAGHDVRIVDAAAAIGGMAASIEVGGQRVDLGSHRLHPSTPPHLLAAIRELLGTDLQHDHATVGCTSAIAGSASRCAASELARRLPPSFALSAARATR